MGWRCTAGRQMRWWRRRQGARCLAALLLLASTRRLAMWLTGAGCSAMLLLGHGYSNS